MASMIGAYTPYDFVPNIYLKILTIVATIVMETSSSNVCWLIPFCRTHSVNVEYCTLINPKFMYIPLFFYNLLLNLLAFACHLIIHQIPLGNIYGR